MKKLTYFLLILGLFGSFSCKKDSLKLKTYDQLNYADIVALNSKLTAADVVVFDGQNELVKPGMVIVYKTHAGTYGKFIYHSWDGFVHFDFMSYKPDGTILLAKQDVTVQGSYTYNFDDGTESTYGNCDIWAKIDAGLLLRPMNGTKFYIYSK